MPRRAGSWVTMREVWGSNEASLLAAWGVKRQYITDWGCSANGAAKEGRAPCAGGPM